MARKLAAIRPEGVQPTSPVFATARGAPLSYHYVYQRVLRPALRASGIAEKDADGTWDYKGVGSMRSVRRAVPSCLHRPERI